MIIRVPVLFAVVLPIAAFGERWTSIGPFGGPIIELCISPSDPSTLYAASHLGGVFRSTNAGLTWREVNKGLPDYHRAISIAVDPVDAEVVYAGFWRDGIYKSINGGRGWAHLSNGVPRTSIQAIEPNPSDSSVVFAGDWDGRVYRTTDSGAQWSLVFASAYSAPVRRLRVAPADPHIVYVAYADKLLRSVDGGSQWSLVIDAPVSISEMTIDPNDSNRIFVATDWAILRTLDGGSTWDVSRMVWGGDVKIHPQDTNLVFSSDAVSTDGGQTWSDLNSTLACRPWKLALDPSDPKMLFASSGVLFFGKGICRSTDRGSTWTPTNDGLNGTTVFHYSLDPLVRHRLIVQTGMGNGVFYSDDRGRTWIDTGLLSTNHGGAVLAHPHVRDLVYAFGTPDFSTDFSLHRSTDGGRTFTSISGVPAYWTLTADPFDPRTLYAPTHVGVSRSADGGITWASTGPFDGIEVEASPGTIGLLYLATGRHGVMKSFDRGLTWSTASSGLTDPQVEWLALDANQPSTLYASTPSGLFKTTDGGDQWTLSAGGPFFGLAISPQDSALLFAARLGGIHVSRDAGMTWESFGLQGYPVVDVAFDPFDPATLYAGTAGNGIFTTRLRPGRSRRQVR